MAHTMIPAPGQMAAGETHDVAQLPIRAGSGGGRAGSDASALRATGATAAGIARQQSKRGHQAHEPRSAKSSLRVGILTYDFAPFIGGQGRVTYGLWRHLREHCDIELSVISPAENDLPGHCSRFPWTRRLGKQMMFSLLANARARRWCDELQLDVLHVNSGPGGVMLMSNPGVPVVCWPHHTYEQSARLLAARGWKSIAPGLERAAYGKARMLVCTTASVESSLRARLRVATEVRRIPCGIDTDAFPALDHVRDADEILCVGRLDRRKQPGLLLAAFDMLSSRYPSLRLAFVGGGPADDALRREVASRRLGGRVSFERVVADQALVERYNRVGLVVTPSAFEGFGLAAVEAQSCGACVVASDVDGLRDVVIDGVTGVLAPPTPAALAAAIAALLDDPSRRRELGIRAATHVRATYGWPDLAAQWAAAYRAAAAPPDDASPAWPERRTSMLSEASIKRDMEGVAE